MTKEEIRCCGNCNICNQSECPYESRPLTTAEYNMARQLDTSVIESRQRVINMTRYIRNRPDKAEYERARDKELEHIDYWRSPEKHRQVARESYQRNKDKRIKHQKQYYQQNKEEISVKQKEYYENNKEEINRKRREQRKASKANITSAKV